MNIRPLLFLLLLITGYTASAQVISGYVMTKQQEPVVGATVMVKGSNRGTTTDSVGKFSIKAGQNELLQFSMVGFVTKELSVAHQTTANIVLEPNNVGLNEVLVIGYGENRRRNINSSIARLDPSTVAQRNTSTANDLLQGQLAGVNVTLSNGLPGSASNVNIRGVSSINGDNQPLYIIDGVQISKANATYNPTGEYTQDPLSLINPSDIASIDVLKDAAAAAIYGNRASNGVVIITTKRGANAKPQVTLSQNYGMQLMYKKMKLLTSDQYMALQREAVSNYNTDMNLTPTSSGYIDINKVLGNVPSDYYDVNWQDLVLNDQATTKQTDVSVSAGNKAIKSYLSAGYLQQDGLLKKSSLDRYSIRGNFDFKVNDHIDVGARLAGNYTRSSYEPNGNQGTALLERSLEQRPYDRVYKADGTYNIGGKDILRHNGVQVLATEQNNDRNYDGMFSFFADIKFLKHFTFHSSYNGEIRNGYGFRHLGMLHPYAYGYGATYDDQNVRYVSSFDNTLDYKKSFGNIIDLDVMAGHTFLKDNYKDNEETGTYFPSDDFKYIGDATVITAGGSNTKTALESYIGRLQLNHSDKYSLTATLRRDGSSKFSKENRYDIFPSVAGGWTISNEPFMKATSNILNYAKLRLSWGKTGNQEGIGNFAYLPLAAGGYNYNGQSGLSITTPGNTNLRWETGVQSNAGLDLEFLDGRIAVTYDYFIKNSNHLLYSLPVLSTSGFSSVTNNIGSMRNTGHEIAITSSNIQHADFKWRTRFNISFVKNKVESLIDNKPIPVGSWNAIIVGQPIGVFYGYKELGIYQSLKDIPQEQQALGVRPGDMKFLDVDHNNIINSSDLTTLGSPLPKFYGGLTNNFEYKNFDLSLFMNFSYGNNIAAAWRGTLDDMGTSDYNKIADHYNQRWTGPGTSNFVPRATKSNYNARNSSYFVEDGSYLRLKNLTIGYSIANSALRRINVNSLRFYVSGTNLLTFTKYAGYDPEVNSTLDAKSAGVDLVSTPQALSLLFGLNVNF